VSLPRNNGGVKQPRQAIELGGFYARWPNARVLIAEEDMALVELHGAGERTLAKIGAGESKIGIGSGVGGGEKAVVLEASGGASGVGEVAVELVGDGDG